MEMTTQQLRRLIREELANEYDWSPASKKKFMLDKEGMEQSDKDNVEEYLKSMGMMESVISEYVRQPYPEYVFEHAYVTNCLGISIPLTESYPYSTALEAQIIQEHILLEGFFDGVKELSGQAKKFWEALKEIFQNPDRIGGFVGAVNKMVLKKMLNPIRRFFTMITEKLAEIGGDVFPTFIKIAENILAGIKKLTETVQGLSGWKKAVGVMGLALGIAWIWKKVGDKIEEGKEKLEEMIPMIDIVAAAGLNEGEDSEESDGKLAKAKEALKSFAEWFKDQIVGQVVDFIKEKLKALGTEILGSALTGGVKKIWSAMTKLYGGAKFVLGTLAPAIERFTFKFESSVIAPVEDLLREYVRAIFNEGVEFRTLDSPLKYVRAGNVKRIALCDTSVKEPNIRPDGKPQRDAYFNEYQETERYGASGRRLKKPRKGKLVPGVSDDCVIGFLDYHKKAKNSDGSSYWYIDYMKTRGDKGGQGTASKLIDEFYSSVAKPGDNVSFGKMMRKEIGHLKDKMVDKYPEIDTIGAVNF